MSWAGNPIGEAAARQAAQEMQPGSAGSEMNPLLSAILTNARRGGGDPSLGPPGPGGDQSLQQQDGGGNNKMAQFMAAHGVVAPMADPGMPFGNITPFGEIMQP